MANLVKVEFLEEHENPFEMVTPLALLYGEERLRGDRILSSAGLYCVTPSAGLLLRLSRSSLAWRADYNNELLIVG